MSNVGRTHTTNLQSKLRKLVYLRLTGLLEKHLHEKVNIALPETSPVT